MNVVRGRRVRTTQREEGALPRGHTPLRRRRYAFKACRSLGVKPSNALKMVRELEAEGLVTYGGMKSHSLTEAGRRRVQELNPKGVLPAYRPRARGGVSEGREAGTYSQHGGGAPRSRAQRDA
jgi:hypothetical protein